MDQIISPIFKPFCAVYLVLLSGNKILLIKKRNPQFPDGYFTLPADHTVENQSVAQIASNILLSKLDLPVDPHRLKFNHLLYRKIADRTYTDLFFSVEIEEFEIDRIINKIPEETEDLAWFSISDLPDSILPHIRTVILDLSQGVNFRELGWGK